MMPELTLQVSDHVIVTIRQYENWRDIHVFYAWLEDGVHSSLFETVVDGKGENELSANLWNTRWGGTTWDLRKVQGVVDFGMRKAFDAYWTNGLKSVGKSEIVVMDKIPNVDIHLVPNLDGGMDEWLVNADIVKMMLHHHTLEDALNRMWALNPRIDGWVKVAKGDIYPDLDDTQELPAVVLDEDDERHQFDLFIVPRLARVKELPALVMVGRAKLGYSLIVGADGDDGKWALMIEHPDGSLGDMSIFKTMRDMIDKMYDLRRILVNGWQMRQETAHGRFDTIFTEEWNRGVSDES